MRKVVTAACAAAAVYASCAALGADKNGVSPTKISRPTGPGSLEGLGDSFQPALNTGTASYSVKLLLPQGVAGFTPELALRYDSGNGYGPAGIGWEFGPGSIRRQTDKGLPLYLDQPAGDQKPDRFLGMDGEELVRLENGYFLAKIEGSFIRYRPVDDNADGRIDRWEAHTKSGTKLEFGLTAGSRVTDATGTKIYRWCLERQTDTNGNVIQYTYNQPSPADRQIYLSEIRYGPGAPPWTHCYKVSLEYEARPDPMRDYRSGFMVRTGKRLKKVSMFFDNTLIRRYEMGYGAHPHWSLLTTVTQFGSDGTSTLPVTIFSYATFNLCDATVPISAADKVIGSVGEPSQVMDSSLAELVDLNADGLPDLLVTDAGHTAYINKGIRGNGSEQVVLWNGPVDLAVADPRASSLLLSAGNVHLADMTGDGISDLVATDSFSVQYFKNTGRIGWGVGQLMSVENDPPPAPFAEQDRHVQTADLDFNKLTDIIRSEAGAYAIWYNLDGGRYEGPVISPGAYYGAQFLDFADAGVQLADMNGDRMTDVVKVMGNGVAYCASMGRGQFDTSVFMPLPDRSLDQNQIARAKMTDINGDGLADLVVERAVANDLWFWLNLGNDTFAESCVITDLPASTNAKTRWADINGNGTTDLIYADSSLPSSKINSVDLAELIAGSSHFNALTGIDNGYGRKTTIHYRSTTDFYAEAAAASNPWKTTVPFPTPVVSRTETTFGLNLDGFDGPDQMATIPVPPGQDVYITDYTYRDGYYDPLEKQFRGFGFVKELQHGDERFGGTTAPTLVTRYGFHTGAPDGLDNDGDGQIDEFPEWGGREEEPLKGVELWRETTVLPDVATEDGVFAPDAKVFERLVATWVVRDLSTSTGGALADLLGVIGSVGTGYRTNDAYGRAVRQAVRTRGDSHVIERGSDAAKTLRTESDIDPLGNQRFESKYGDLSNARDDLYTGSEYVLDSSAESSWIIDRLERQYQKDGCSSGTFVSETRNYYDGEPFVGLPLGQLGSHGDLHRTESFISGDPVPALTERSYVLGDPRDPSGRVDTLRQQFDANGNPVILRDANGHDRIIAYDDLLHAFPTRETIVLADGKPDLVVNATYDYRFGKPLTVADFNNNVSTFGYDTFGRLEKEILPGDDPGTPTHTYSYQLGAPISSITTTAHTCEGGSLDVVTRLFFDGMGRKLGLWEAGGPVMKEVTLYNQRGQGWKVFSPFAGGDGTWSAPAGSLPAVTSTYDASGRVLETISPPDNNGEVARATKEYLPLQTVERDGEDNRPGSPHFNTPKFLVNDGLGRLIEVHEIETLSAADSGTFITSYRYAMPDRLAEIEDAKSNIKYMRYDGLGRRVFMNDLDRGYMVYTFDAAGNLLNTVDAKGQQIVYTYDGANRLLTEDYLDDASPLSLRRTPDVAYHYDKPNPDRPELRNVIGKLAWVEDLTGAEFASYDTRGNPETVVKRISQIEGGTKDYTTVSYADSLGRVYQIIYPDGGVVRYEYDARGLLRTIPGFLNQATYYPSGQKQNWPLGNGVVTSYTYDPRLRLSGLFTQGTAEVLQDLNYVYDQADNITAISDSRPLPPGDPRSQTASYLMDNSYHLARADGVGWSQEFDYDRLGNMTKKLSSDPDHPEEHIGTMLSGGSSGTIGHVGRNCDDPPGPHALTSADNGTRQRVFDYDCNGNMTNNDGDGYVYDSVDRLGRVIKDSRDIRYFYDYTGRRVIKRVDGVQTTYISKLSEIRDDQMINYVFAGETRLARVDGMINPPTVVTQRIPLVEGRNLISFQVEPTSTDPAVLLAGLVGNLTTVFGYDGAAYTRYEPGRYANTLTAILPNRGYWVYMSEAAVLLIDGPVSGVPVSVPPDRPVLVGLPGFAPRTAEDVLLHYPALRWISTYSTGKESWRYFSTLLPRFVNTLLELPASSGCWLVCSEPTAFLVSPLPAIHLSYYHQDHLDSTSVLTSDTGHLLEEHVYYPFGTPRHDTRAHPVTPNTPYRFAGRERDTDSDLVYFGARYSLTSCGHFTSPDLLAGVLTTTGADNFAQRLLDPQKLHSYAYVLSNPMRFVDEAGFSEDNPPSSVVSLPQGSPASLPTLVGKVSDEHPLSGSGTAKIIGGEVLGIALTFAGGIPHVGDFVGLGSTLWDEHKALNYAVEQRGSLESLLGAADPLVTMVAGVAGPEAAVISHGLFNVARAGILGLQVIAAQANEKSATAHLELMKARVYCLGLAIEARKQMQSSPAGSFEQKQGFENLLRARVGYQNVIYQYEGHKEYAADMKAFFEP